MNWRIIQGDLFDVLPTLQAESIDACVTDPPYGLGFMGKEWDTFRPGAEQARILLNDDADSNNPNLRGRKRAPASSPSAVEHDRSLKGQHAFQDWTERWAREVFRVLKPGAHLLVCGAPRSFHRMTCGIEDAGFEVRDCLSWNFAQGFPKSLDVSKAIDKAAGAERQGAGPKIYPGGHVQNHGGDKQGYHDWKAVGVYEDSFPATDAARQWEGWGTALKPAWEPIILARKPLASTVAANVLQHGTGALNIDACRIEGLKPEMQPTSYTRHGEASWRTSGATGTGRTSEVGRWPANAIFDEEAAAMLDEMSGELCGPGGPAVSGSETAWPGGAIQGRIYPGERGGASRFFYVAKPDRAERDQGCDSLPARSAGECTDREEDTAGLNSPRAGAGRTGGGRNHHPTVKPVALMGWLVRLVTPPGGIVLDPFTGSGTTGMACLSEGRNFLGVEREAEYVELARKRIGSVAPLLATELTA